MNGSVELWIVSPDSGVDGSKPPFVTLSTGIAECRNHLEIKQVFNTADQERYVARTRIAIACARGPVIVAGFVTRRNV